MSIKVKLVVCLATVMNQHFHHVPAVTSPIMLFPDQIHLFGDNMDKLHEHFHPSTLPDELAGTLPPYDGTSWTQTIVETTSSRTRTGSVVSGEPAEERGGESLIGYSSSEISEKSD